MHVQILPDTPFTVFTNLDIIRGRIVLRLPTTTPIVSIIVKLEGESRTRLLAQLHPRDERAKPVEELHKILYKTTQVFPTTNLPLTSHLTLAPGQYEYPFEFKLPFNNSCDVNTSSAGVKLAGLSLEVPRAVPRDHIKTTLPPTLTTFPGLAEVRYYLKVTVNRKEFYKENPRVVQYFDFIPIEPPRQNVTQAETYARRQHEFLLDLAGAKLKKAFFRKASDTTTTIMPKISLDARLPSPSIITCNTKIPLRLLVKRLNDSDEFLYLQSIQIELIGHTRIRAHQAFRQETNGYIIVSRSNMNVLLHRPTDTSPATSSKASIPPISLEEIEIDPTLWAAPLPASIAPTFQSCNIKRTYDLELRIGIGWGTNATRNAAILPLRLPVSVYSGIRPPPGLATQAVVPPPKPPRKPVPAAAAASSSSAGPSYAPLPPGAEESDEPPPTYEDAVGQDLAPVDGPRNYRPPAMEGGGGFESEGKRRGS